MNTVWNLLVPRPLRDRSRYGSHTMPAIRSCADHRRAFGSGHQHDSIETKTSDVEDRIGSEEVKVRD